MGQPTLSAWKICSVGFWLIEVEDFARPEAVAGYPARPSAGLWAVRTTVQVSKHCLKVSTPEYIGCKKRTQGTETSKYLQERTSTETPQVVASERGPGQWHQVLKWNKLESLAVVGDSPVRVDTFNVLE